MAGPTYLKVVLKLMALYAGVMASLTLMFQEAGSFLFQYHLQDMMLARYWGGILLAMAIFYLFLSTDPVKYRLFIWVGVFDLGVASILTIVHIATTSISWVQGITGLILNPIFLVILIYGLAREKEGKVVLVSGNEGSGHEQQIPEHARGGRHPLHGK